MNATTTADFATLRFAPRPCNATTDFARNDGSFSTLTGLTLTAKSSLANGSAESFSVFTGATWYRVERVEGGWEMPHPVKLDGTVLFSASLEHVVSMHGRLVNRAAKLRTARARYAD